VVASQQSPNIKPARELTFVCALTRSNPNLEADMQIAAPDHLSEDAAKWWRSVNREYDLEDHHLRLLTLAAEAWDRTQQAREVLAKEGLIYTDRFNAPRARPEVSIERDSRLAFARLLRELDLDVTLPPDALRPPSLRSNRGAA
jgi:phage terminase small subunit